MNARKKEGRSARKKSHFKVQALRTAQNKTRQNLARIRRLKTRPKQEKAAIGEIGPGETVFMGTVINRAKQHRRKTRNIQRQNRYKQQKAATETVLAVVESTAE